MLKKGVLIIVAICVIAITLTAIVRLSIIPVSVDGKYPAFYNIWTQELDLSWLKEK